MNLAARNHYISPYMGEWNDLSVRLGGSGSISACSTQNAAMKVPDSGALHTARSLCIAGTQHTLLPARRAVGPMGPQRAFSAESACGLQCFHLQRLSDDRQEQVLNSARI